MMLTIEQQANRWVVRQSEGGLVPAQQAAFDAWCAADARHLGAFARASAIHFAIGQALAQGAPRTLPMNMEAPERPPAPRRKAWRFLRYGALAAGIATVFLVAPLFTRPASASFATATGEFRRVPLADQSIANINSGSQIDVVLTDRLRQVELKKGEAWFEVAKDKSRPFVVSAGDARVRAVGTSFSVHRHAAGAEILVTEGVVEVWRNGNDAPKRLVAAGERAVVPERGDQITIARQPDEIARELAWREGKLVFVNQTLGLAVEDFNRYSRKQIVIADQRLARKTLAGQFRINDPEQFARAVGTLLDAPIAITHDRIIVGDVRLLDPAVR